MSDDDIEKVFEYVEAFLKEALNIIEARGERLGKLSIKNRRMPMGKIYAMSDIHGFLEIMEENLKIINFQNKSNKLVLCGDYVGYGPKSCQVLYRIKELMERHPQQVVALKGNHETMFLDFLEADHKDVWNIE